MFGVFKLLPLDCTSAVGGALARRIGPFLGVSRHARRNISRAFPELSETEIADLVGGMWSNLGRVAAGRPMIVFSGHIANWEIGMLAGAQHGISVAQIHRALNNPLMDRMIARFRGDRGEFIPKGAVAAGRAIAALRRGTHLGLLADQKMNDGIPVPFFGRPAMTAPALAVLALRFDCDVLPLRAERLDGARFRVTVFPPLPLPRSGEPHADAAALMARVNEILEAGSVTARSNGSGCANAGRTSRRQFRHIHPKLGADTNDRDHSTCETHDPTLFGTPPGAGAR